GHTPYSVVRQRVYDCEVAGVINNQPAVLCRCRQQAPIRAKRHRQAYLVLQIGFKGIQAGPGARAVYVEWLLRARLRDSYHRSVRAGCCSPDVAIDTPGQTSERGRKRAPVSIVQLCSATVSTEYPAHRQRGLRGLLQLGNSDLKLCYLRRDHLEGAGGQSHTCNRPGRPIGGRGPLLRSRDCDLSAVHRDNAHNLMRAFAGRRVGNGDGADPPRTYLREEQGG